MACRPRVWGWGQQGEVAVLWAYWQRWVWVQKAQLWGALEELLPRRPAWPEWAQGGSQGHWALPGALPADLELKGLQAWQVGSQLQALRERAEALLVRAWLVPPPRVWLVPWVPPLLVHPPSSQKGWLCRQVLWLGPQVGCPS